MRDEILTRTTSLLEMMTDAEEITEESELMNDLGISSSDVLMLMASLEEEFSIKVPEKYIRRMTTVGDIADVVESLLV